ncbi:4'-phosphopantetheinyl transferase [Methylophaga lonarensis MPL]|uniref:Holo-[acyl-carrier-protein] synthase n=1 Tax=Methylophaga lonarensis MPL TaxID=1286106 RepID=M7PF13_9GAMM|nr:holo-ACP synthase [Methylophaga lonarensis]EMR12490.1 4'-phosphopantetheinyl transferase [Methylophaga lonarensis MPL]
MICGIGTDLVFIPRISQMLEKFGDKAARRILDEQEFLAFQQSSMPAAFLAKRFAAKEAAAKALGTGFRDGLSLQHIAVRKDELGKPELKLIEVAQHRMSELKASRAFLSLSDDGDYASAYVILTER